MLIELFFVIFISVILKMLPIDSLWVIFIIFISVTLKKLPIDAQWVIFIIFFLLFWKCYQLILCELSLSYSFYYFENVTNWFSVCYFYHIQFCCFENVTNWFSVSYFYHILSVILKMLPIDSLWVIFIILFLLFWKCYQLMLSELFLSYSFLLFWKCYQLMLCELFLLYSFCYFENVTNWFSVSYFYHIISVILKMLLIDAQRVILIIFISVIWKMLPIDVLWVIFIIFLLSLWKCFKLKQKEYDKNNSQNINW